MTSILLLVCLGVQTTAPAPDWPFETAAATPLGGTYGFTEGPVWVPKPDGIFVFCDMSGDALYSWSSKVGDQPNRFALPSGRAVGSAAAADGTVFQVQTAGRKIGKWRIDNNRAHADATVFASAWDGKKLGGMNDLAVHPNGSVYVTHAEWFIDPLTKEVDHSGVIRIDKDGKVSDAVNGLARPNGICFSPDGKTAYVTEFSAGRILKFRVEGSGKFAEKQVFANLAAMAAERKIEGRGGADGLRTDRQGRVYSTGPAGIWVLDEKGHFIAHLPMRATNLAFGGPDGKTLLITTGNGVATIRSKVPG